MQGWERSGRCFRRVFSMSSAAIVLRRERAIPSCPPALARIHEGDSVVAEDGPLGRVDGLVRSEADVPLYLIVRVGRLRRRYPVVPASLVAAVDSRRRLVELGGQRATIARLPETLPSVL